MMMKTKKPKNDSFSLRDFTPRQGLSAVLYQLNISSQDEDDC